MRNAFMMARGLVIVLALLVLAACGGTSGEPGAAISVQDPWVRPAVMTGMSDAMDQTDAMTEGMDHGGEMPHAMTDMDSVGGNSAAYMRLVNTGDSNDAVISAATDVAQIVELHITEMNEQGVMSMRPVEQIDIPADGETELMPGGLHVMLIDLTQDLQAGQTVNLTLTLQSGAEIEVAAPVGEPAGE